MRTPTTIRRSRPLAIALAGILGIATVAATAAPVPSRTTEAERAAVTGEVETPEAGAGGEVAIFGVVLLVFVVVAYLLKTRD